MGNQGAISPRATALLVCVIDDLLNKLQVE